MQNFYEVRGLQVQKWLQEMWCNCRQVSRKKRQILLLAVKPGPAPRPSAPNCQDCDRIFKPCVQTAPACLSTRRSFDHHGKGNGNFVQKRVSKNEKKVVSLLDLKEMKARNDCEIACDCVKRANVVLHVRLCKEIFARKHTATHKPTSAQPTHMCHDDTHTHTRLWSPLAYGLGGNNYYLSRSYHLTSQCVRCTVRWRFVKERGACRSWPMPAYWAGLWLDSACVVSKRF